MAVQSKVLPTSLSLHGFVHAHNVTDANNKTTNIVRNTSRDLKIYSENKSLNNKNIIYLFKLVKKIILWTNILKRKSRIYITNLEEYTKIL